MWRQGIFLIVPIIRQMEEFDFHTLGMSQRSIEKAVVCTDDQGRGGEMGAGCAGISMCCYI